MRRRGRRQSGRITCLGRVSEFKPHAGSHSGTNGRPVSRPEAYPRSYSWAEPGTGSYARSDISRPFLAATVAALQSTASGSAGRSEADLGRFGAGEHLA